MNELKTLQEEGDRTFRDKIYFLKHTDYFYWLYDVLYNNEDASKAFIEYVEQERQKSYTLGIMKGVELVEGELPKYPPNSDREELVLEQIKGIINKLKQELK